MFAGDNLNISDHTNISDVSGTSSNGVNKFGSLKEKLSKQQLNLLNKNFKITVNDKHIQKYTQKANRYLLKAQTALNELNKKNFTELRKLGKFGKWRIYPIPAAVYKIITAVMVLLSEPDNIIPNDESWKYFKTMVKKDTIMNKLNTFDGKVIINPSIHRIVQFYLKDFSAKYVTETSKAAACLYTWVINIMAFNKIWQEVEQKKKEYSLEIENKKIIKKKINELKKLIEEVEIKEEIIYKAEAVLKNDIPYICIES